MAENQTPRKLGYTDYEYGLLADTFARSQESGQYANGALNRLTKDISATLGIDPDAFRGHFTAVDESGPAAIARAAEVYAGMFREKRNDVKLSEAVKWYSIALDGLSDEEKETITKVLLMYNITYGKLMEEISDALNISNASDRVHPKDSPKRKEAEQNLEKYGPIAKLMKKLDGYKLETLRGGAVKETRVPDLRSDVKSLEKLLQARG